MALTRFSGISGNSGSGICPSITATFKPLCSKASAKVNPTMPPPMIITSVACICYSLPIARQANLFLSKGQTAKAISPIFRATANSGSELEKTKVSAVVAVTMVC